jgi:hypothetical protein
MVTGASAERYSVPLASTWSINAKNSSGTYGIASRASTSSGSSPNRALSDRPAAPVRPGVQRAQGVDQLAVGIAQREAGVGVETQLDPGRMVSNGDSAASSM